MTDQQFKPCSVLIAHNRYRQTGGEESVVAAELALLKKHGHAVQVYSRDNDELGGVAAGRAAKDAFWSARTVRDMVQILTAGQFQIVHVHNSFPLISPSIYWAAARVGVPVIQTLHNFRLLCPQGMFLRNGHVCEDCFGHVPWRGVAHRCYRRSAAQSSVLAGMLTFHRIIGTWKRKVTRYIALNNFCRQKFIEGGLPDDRIVIKPNFVDLEGESGQYLQRATSGTGNPLFVGRLSPEKGIAVLLAAMDKLPDVSVEFVGAGTEMAGLRLQPRAIARGGMSRAEVFQKMTTASYLVLPSLCYENFPLTVIEAFACGLPVIASRLGAMAELIEDGRTGVLFEPGDASDLAAKMAWAWANPDAMRRMADAARAEYEAKYTPAKNYGQLMAIYDDAIAAGPMNGR